MLAIILIYQNPNSKHVGVVGFRITSIPSVFQVCKPIAVDFNVLVYSFGNENFVGKRSAMPVKRMNLFLFKEFKV